MARPGLSPVRHRFPRTVAFGTAVAATLHLADGCPYGPVLLLVAVGCFAAVVAGRRVAAWSAVAPVRAGHLLVAHWLYRWLPPGTDGAAPCGQELVVTAWAVATAAASEPGRVRREQLVHGRAERAAAERRRTGEERLRIATTHVSRTMVELGARGRAQLVVPGYESGPVRPGRLG
ncbi:hypothetical protein [Streptomyces sclerotialus]|uniref:hypothetical protein n=1 Tax=Streptomyces sclerotialus TaxID=1957 RepID=UPI0004C8D33D